MTQAMTTAPQESPVYLPVTPEQARQNRRVLAAALREHERARKQAGQESRTEGGGGQ
jgi:hypothetical protein